MNFMQNIYFSPLNNLHKFRENEIVNFWQINDNWDISALIKRKEKKSVTDLPPLYFKGAKVDSIKKRVIYLIEIFKKQLVVMFYNFSQGLCFIQNTNI